MLLVENQITCNASLGMKYHTSLSISEWQKQSVAQQMANIGSEVLRALSWKKKNDGIAQRAFERSLELFDASKHTRDAGMLQEVCRAREIWVDYFACNNIYQSTEEQWRKYFYQFTYLARNEK